MTLIVKNETTMVDTGRMSRVTLHYTSFMALYVQPIGVLIGYAGHSLNTLAYSEYMFLTKPIPLQP